MFEKPTRRGLKTRGPWANGLNPARLEAVTSDPGPTLVVAGAGTGKTLTLASRVAYLIEQGVQPGRILLLTFTRRAAREMLERAGRMTGETSTGKVWGGTFHAMANRLLRLHGRSIGVRPDFTRDGSSRRRRRHEPDQGRPWVGHA